MAIRIPLRARMRARAARTLVASLLFAALALAGCAHKSASDGETASSSATGKLLAAGPGDAVTDEGRGREFYPLTVGNSWDYHAFIRVKILDDTDPPPPNVPDLDFVVHAQIAGARLMGGLEYFEHRETVPPDLPYEGMFLRQDRSGLFQHFAGDAQPAITVDRSAADPVETRVLANIDRVVVDPARRDAIRRAAAEAVAKLAQMRRGVTGIRPSTAAGPAPGDLTLLSYPLSPGASWTVFDWVLTREVERHERITLPIGRVSAWRIRATSKIAGPHDTMDLWYSDLGLLRVRSHMEGYALIE